MTNCQRDVDRTATDMGESGMATGAVVQQLGLPIGGFGIVGLGVAGAPPRYRTRPDLCSEHGHPGATYNPWHDRTWCLCGHLTYSGNQHQHVACCGGPLVEDVA